MKKISGIPPVMIGLLTVSALSAQSLAERDSVPLKNWDAPMYWQPSAVDSKDAAARQMLAGNSGVVTASSTITPDAQTPANSLVFVGMTPCRVVDTRTGSGFTGAFGPPSLTGGVSRTFPIQLSPQCSIPSIAQAYSFNITAVPPGFLDFITVWPTGQPRPNASTLNGYVGTVIANAAIVPAGTSGSVDVFASQNTNLIIDINGYYAPQTGITLAQGTASSPSLSFVGDAGTGIFSSGTGTLNLVTGGTSRLSVASNGDMNLAGNLDVSGNSIVHGTLGVGPINTPQSERLTIIQPTPNTWSEYLATTGLGPGQSFGLVTAAGTNSQDASIYARDQAGNPLLLVRGDGNVGMGTNAPQSRLHVSSTNTGSTSLTLENVVKQTSRQVILSNYGITGAGLYWPDLDSANTSSLLGFNLFVLRSTDGLAFSGSSTAEHMRITPEGKVGIGTSAPDGRFKLHVVNSGLSNSGGVYGVGNGVGVHGVGNGNAVLSRGVLGEANAVNGVGVEGHGNNTGVYGLGNTGVAGFGNQDGVFGNSTNGVGVRGNSLTYYAGHFGNDIFVNGSVDYPSDVRLKEAIADIEYGIREVMKLRPVTWNWKGRPDRGQQMGLIAQDVEAVLPGLVRTNKDEDETKALNYTGLLPVTIKAIQQQQAQIEEQQGQIHNQQLQIEELKHLVCLDRPEAAVCK